jgi:hypothetical protein
MLTPTRLLEKSFENLVQWGEAYGTLGVVAFMEMSFVNDINESNATDDALRANQLLIKAQENFGA